MLKEMRRRVIIAAMLAFFAVISMIAIMINVVNYCVVTNRADKTLSTILDFERSVPSDPQAPSAGGPGGSGVVPKMPMKPFMGLPDVEDNYMTRFFTVRFDKDRNVVLVWTDNIAAIDEEEAVAYAKKGMEKAADHGYMKEYRYLREENENGTIVIFLNTMKEQRSMKTILILTIIVSLVSLLIVFILVAVFSGRAIRPIANNIRQQKQFITDAGHELKTPLTSISTSLDVIAMNYGDDEWIDNIRKQTRRMSKLVGELVTLSRLDEDNALPNKENFSLSSVAHEIADVYRPQAKAHEKEFSVEIEENLDVFGEKAAIQKMLSVLLDNALRYSDANGEIRFNVFKKRNRIHIEVFNTCRYETPPDVERLFDRFYRPDSSRSTETGGNGVGLSIAKAVAQAHGGTISASCPSGNTMTIHISF